MNKLIPNSSNNNQPSQRSMSLSQHRQSMASSGLGDSPTSSASSPVASGQPRTTRSQSTGGFSSSMQPGIHSTPTSCCRPIRGTSLFRYEMNFRQQSVGFLHFGFIVVGSRVVRLWNRFWWWAANADTMGKVLRQQNPIFQCSAHQGFQA